jgi:putative transposase
LVATREFLVLWSAEIRSEAQKWQQPQLWHDHGVLSAFFIIVCLALDLLQWCELLLMPRRSLEAENLFLRRQLALYRERGVKPKRVDAATRVTLALLSRCFDWHSALVVARPETLIRWHRAGFCLWWRWRSRPGRPSIPKEFRKLIRRMARENPAWGQERIANELLLKLGLRVSPRTVAKYMPRPAPGQPRGDQRWSTFLRNHARAIIACDFCVAVTGTFQVLYVLVVIEHHSRRLIHFNVTAHPTAEWTRQQLREAVGYEERYRSLLHDRDTIFPAELDESIQRLGLHVLKSPPRSPEANAICERVIGTLRRECLDWLIPLSEAHLRQTLKTWVAHYNRGRPHSALGPGVPDPPANSWVSPSKLQHRRWPAAAGCRRHWSDPHFSAFAKRESSTVGTAGSVSGRQYDAITLQYAGASEFVVLNFLGGLIVVSMIRSHSCAKAPEAVVGRLLATYPPSREITCPERYDARDEVMNATRSPTSEGSAARLKGRLA